jgi:hypothetical protein
MSQVDITETETELKDHFNICMQITNTKENHFHLSLNCFKMPVFQVPGSGIFFDAFVLRQYSGRIHIAYSDIALCICVACKCDGGK